jgi:ABC-type amino acid transport substrate-binding protein
VRSFVLFLVLGLPGFVGAEGHKLVFETPDILAPFVPAVMDRITRAGLKAEVQFAPYVRLQQDLGKGAVDGAFFLGESFLKASSLYQAVPVPLYRNEYMAVTMAGGPDIRTPQDLGDKTVGYPRGYVGMAAVTGAAPVTTVVDEEQGFRILGAGRIQVLIVSRTSAQMFSAVAGKPVQIHEPPLLTSLLYLVVRRSLSTENAALTTRFRESIADGSWERDVADVVRRQSKTR